MTEYLTMGEYLKTAKNVINHMKTNVRPTDDNIAYVAERMAFADKKFNGNGSRTGYRISIGQYAVKTLSVTLAKKSKKNKCITLSGAEERIESSTRNLIDKFSSFEEEHNKTEIVEKIIKDFCPPKYQELITDIFIKGMKNNEVVAKYKTTRQNLHIKMQLALRNIKEKLNESGISSWDYFSET